MKTETMVVLYTMDFLHCKSSLSDFGIPSFSVVLMIYYKIINNQSNNSFDSTNRFCLVIIDYNRKDLHVDLTLL